MRVLVTGSARRIGAGIARRLARHGHQVCLHHHGSADEAGALGAEIGAPVLCAELADESAVRGLIGAAQGALGGPVEGLVNNASSFEWDDWRLGNLGLLDRLMRVNAAAPVLLAGALAAQDDLAEGAVVNLLDQKVANLNPDFFSYTLSKLALQGATQMLAQALAPKVRVNAVSPGLTLPSLDQSEAEFAAVAGANLLGRRVALDDIAAAVEHLLTARSITGQNVFVDCGQRFLPRMRDVMFATRERPDG